MTLTQPIVSYNSYGFAAVDRVTKLPFGKFIQLNGGMSINPNAQVNTLTGGGEQHNVAAELGTIDTEIQVTAKETPPWLYTLAGYDVVENAAEAAGSVNNFANSIGTSVLDATTGIATATVVTAADLKPGTYLVKAVSPTTIDVYKVSNFGAQLGTDLSIVDDTMKITASALTIVASSSVTIPGTGVQLDGGSGTIGMTTDDISVFEVRIINAASQTISMPFNPLPINFEAHIFSDIQADKSYNRTIAFKCFVSPFELPLPDKAFSEYSLTIKVLKDCSLTKLYEMDVVQGGC